MTPSDDRSPESLARRADELAAANEWAELHEFLSSLDRDLLLDRRALASRFGEALYHTDRVEELGEFARAFEAAARSRADVPGILWAVAAAGNAAFQLGETEDARSRYERLVELAEAEDDDEMLAKGFNNLGALATLRGQPDEALSYYQLAQPLYERLAHTEGTAQLKHNQSISYRDLGCLDDAVQSARQAIALAEEIGNEPLVIVTSLGRTETEIRRGDVAMSRELIDRVFPRAEATGNPHFEAEALRIRGLVAKSASPPDPESALDDLGEALEKLAAVRRPLLEAETERDRAEVLLETGRADAAESSFRRARRIFASIGADAYAREVEERLDRRR